jgi:predicted Ser/Thr protein kinase
MALTYLKKYKKHINLEIWDTAIINLENVNEQDLNGFLLYRIAYYKDSKYNNTAL